MSKALEFNQDCCTYGHACVDINEQYTFDLQGFIDECHELDLDRDTGSMTVADWCNEVKYFNKGKQTKTLRWVDGGDEEDHSTSVVIDGTDVSELTLEQLQEMLNND